MYFTFNLDSFRVCVFFTLLTKDCLLDSRQLSEKKNKIKTALKENQDSKAR
jgi:hypothetical protein